jgi:hypothetical protein
MRFLHSSRDSLLADWLIFSLDLEQHEEMFFSCLCAADRNIILHFDSDLHKPYVQFPDLDIDEIFVFLEGFAIGRLQIS